MHVILHKGLPLLSTYTKIVFLAALNSILNACTLSEIRENISIQLHNVMQFPAVVLYSWHQSAWLPPGRRGELPLQPPQYGEWRRRPACDRKRAWREGFWVCLSLLPLLQGLWSAPWRPPGTRHGLGGALLHALLQRECGWRCGQEALLGLRLTSGV